VPVRGRVVVFVMIRRLVRMQGRFLVVMSRVICTPENGNIICMYVRYRLTS
jgi:hypothetical protein